ncbi:hypothetical protein A3753_30455 [Sulfitobacter sp. HI0082]|nr:hypothetical protein A3753_30835 [Sulfitobacter sp. HI0082]KZZ27786.1 hypothetical protein A3753_30455 [Sulfitobacter sp. HI0082]
MEPFSKWSKPITIKIGIFISVAFLANQTEGRRGHDEIHTVFFSLAKQIATAVPPQDLAMVSL